MPGLDGATLIRKVRAKYKDMPIIITTGHSEFEGVYKNVFNIETLTKPYTVMEILDAINNFTRNKEIVKKCDDAYEKIEEVFIEAQRVLDLIK
jgi:FixJ family two-component response regulator